MTNLDRTRQWAERSGPMILADQLPGAIRAGNFARAAILRDVLDRKTKRRQEWIAARRVTPPVRATRMCAAWHPIAADVAKRHGVTVADMLSGWRTKVLRDARWEFWFLLSQRGVSLAEIGRRTGGYDHTSVMHGVRQWAARIEQESTNG